MCPPILMIICFLELSCHSSDKISMEKVLDHAEKEYGVVNKSTIGSIKTKFGESRRYFFDGLSDLGLKETEWFKNFNFFTNIKVEKVWEDPGRDVLNALYSRNIIIESDSYSIKKPVDYLKSEVFQVLLLYGNGGFGKTRYLKALHALHSSPKVGQKSKNVV